MLFWHWMLRADVHGLALYFVLLFIGTGEVKDYYICPVAPFTNMV